MSVAQMKKNRPHAAARRTAIPVFVEPMRRRDCSVVLYRFDLLHLDGFDLTGCPLITRTALLRHILPKDNTGRIRTTDHIIGEGEAPKIRTSVGKDSQRKPKRNLGLVPLDIPMCYSNET